MKNEIKLTPQKEFFINMITRDITLEAAIMELIDNSIDGYKRSKINNPLIEIIIDDDLIEIKDNCGGIPLEIAKNSAFNFGKAEEDFDGSKIDLSIGRFGIGMKRSIFKIGNKIEISTFDGKDNYMIAINVEEWKKSPAWDLSFEEIKEKADIGTRIRINELNIGINKIIKNPIFINKLIQLIKLDFKEYIIDNVDIKITYKGSETDISDSLEVEELVDNDIVKPNISIFEKDGVMVKFVVGAIKRRVNGDRYDPSKAGWYLYCNNRLVICSDQSKLTGWGISPVPKFHVQKARRFRGYCFLESVDSRKLPWNTTKTSVEEESELYIFLKSEMKVLTETYIKIIDRIEELDEIQDKEKIDLYDSNKTITASNKWFENSTEQIGSILAVVNKEIPHKVTISYKKDRGLIDKLIEEYDEKTAADIGRKTFDYFLEMEGVKWD